MILRLLNRLTNLLSTEVPPAIKIATEYQTAIYLYRETVMALRPAEGAAKKAFEQLAGAKTDAERGDIGRQYLKPARDAIQLENAKLRELLERNASMVARLSYDEWFKVKQAELMMWTEQADAVTELYQTWGSLIEANAPNKPSLPRSFPSAQLDELDN